MRALLRVILCLLPLASAAQDLPGRYSVTDVAADDRLNIRAAPNAGAPTLGDYPPFAINIEVLRITESGKWGMIGRPEGNGWVSMRYLAPSPPADPYSIPRPFTCHGTEPFWTLSITARGADFTELDNSPVALSANSEDVAKAGYVANFSQGPEHAYVLISERLDCSDGMSDRIFGFSAHVFESAPQGNRLLRGCCTMDHGR